MKKHISTIIFLAIIFLGIFFIIKTALGLVVITGEDIDIEYNPLSGGFPLCQSFKLDTIGATTIEDIVTRGWYNDSWNSENWTYMGLYGPYDTQVEANTAFGRFGSCHDHFEKEIIWENQVTMPIDVLGDIIWEINTELTGGKWFYVYFGISSIGPAYIAGTANGYTEGALAIRAGGDLNGATQIALSLNLVPPPPADTIEIIYPTSTPPYNFSNWIIAFTTATTTTATSTDFYLKDIYIGETTSTIDNLTGSAGSGESPQELNNWYILSPNTTYYSQAILKYFHPLADPQISIVATSSIVSFTTSFLPEEDLSIYEIPISEATSSLWTITCDPESGFFENSLCKLAQYLFVPTQISVQNLVNLKAEVELKPPIGYFKLIKEAVENLNASGEAAFTLVGVGGLSGLLDKVKDVLSIILYLVFGFWLLKRVINFDFHL